MKSNSEKFQEIILDSIADGVFTVDNNYNITSFNKSAEKIIGISRTQAIGKNCRDVFLADICDKNCVLRRTLKTGKPCINKTVHIINQKGDKIPISITTAILKGARGKIVGGVETFRDMSMVESLRKEVLGKHSFQDIITKDHQMLKIFDMLPGAAQSNSTILITGESGTGKELLAKAIHSLSDRSNGPFISVNCGALPDTLLESELFGYKKGAFTDAKQDKPGRIKLAEGGSLFLDEIGDTSKSFQVKLLRFLQEKSYEPLGGIKPIHSNTRVITATNQNLHKLMQKDEFRTDLYYRINVLTIELPALSHRKADIPLLIDVFIARYNNLYGKTITGLSDKAISILMKYEFPGNIRELQNILEHATIMCPTTTIEPAHFPKTLNVQNQPKPQSAHKPTSIGEFEKEQILEALQKCHYHKQQTAKMLNMHSSTLWRKMKKLGIKF